MKTQIKEAIKRGRASYRARRPIYLNPQGFENFSWEEGYALGREKIQTYVQNKFLFHIEEAEEQGYQELYFFLKKDDSEISGPFSSSLGNAVIDTFWYLGFKIFVGVYTTMQEAFVAPLKEVKLPSDVEGIPHAFIVVHWEVE